MSFETNRDSIIDDLHDLPSNSGILCVVHGDGANKKICHLKLRETIQIDDLQDVLDNGTNIHVVPQVVTLFKSQVYFLFLGQNKRSNSRAHYAGCTFLCHFRRSIQFQGQSGDTLSLSLCTNPILSPRVSMLDFIVRMVLQ